MRNAGTFAAQRGFTLIEAILVIVVIGVLTAVIAVFIRAPVQGYVDSVGRAEVSDTADVALRRMARDLRLALPNSIRGPNDGSAIEFLLTKAGGRYLSEEDGAAGGDVLDWTDADDRTFTVVGPLKSLEKVVPGDLVVINNGEQGTEQVDAYLYAKRSDPTVKRNIARVESYDKNNALFTLIENPFALQDPPSPSPTQRFQVISGPVSYYCAPDNNGNSVLWRHWGYEITSTAAFPPVGGESAIVASGVHTCQGIFKFGNDVNQRSALVVLTLQLRARNSADPAIRLVHQVHVDNTP